MEWALGSVPKFVPEWQRSTRVNWRSVDQVHAQISHCNSWFPAWSICHVPFRHLWKINKATWCWREPTFNFFYINNGYDLDLCILWSSFKLLAVILSEIWIIFQSEFWSSHGQTDRQTDRQTESDAYEPSVHKHRCAQKENTSIQLSTADHFVTSYRNWNHGKTWDSACSAPPTCHPRVVLLLPSSSV